MRSSCKETRALFVHGKDIWVDFYSVLWLIRWFQFYSKYIRFKQTNSTYLPFILLPHFVSFCRSINYHGESNFSALLTPITFLISYFNSAFNPLLYAFLSRNFRKGMREIILCSFKKSNKKSLNQRIPLHVSKSVFWQIFRCRFFQRKVYGDEQQYN